MSNDLDVGGGAHRPAPRQVGPRRRPPARRHGPGRASTGCSGGVRAACGGGPVWFQIPTLPLSPSSSLDTSRAEECRPDVGGGRGRCSAGPCGRWRHGVRLLICSMDAGFCELRMSLSYSGTSWERILKL